MKVIHFIASIDELDGGTTAYMKLLSGSLKRLITLEIATCKSKKPVLIPEVPITFFEFSLKNLLKLKNQIKKYLIERSPDIVHINGIWNLQNAIFHYASKELNLPIILSPHGMLEPYILKRNSWKKKLALILYQKKVLKEIKYFHATSQLELNNIKKIGFEKEFIIIPNGINIEVFSKLKPIKSDNPKKILFLSRIHPKKGIEFLIEAWSKLDNQSKNNWIVEIIGNGDENYIKELEEKINFLKMESQIRIKNPVFGNEKIDVFRESSLFVLPTFSENFGIVIVEALASYTPVITTIGTPWEELNVYNCGWCIPIGTEALKNTLEIALNKSASKIELMGEKGRELVEKKYSIELIANQMYNFYKNILKNEQQ